jgi:probable H4MPT-linked C1 transfer pathway protein
VHVYGTDGRFRSPDRARAEPIAVAASNWHASASLAAREHPDAILVDVGSTTTDVIPIVDGAVVARGRTDPERLAHGELLYLGALRTPVEAIVQEVPLRGEMAGVSAEGFALAGDVHLWRGDLDPAAYTASTPDGRPATREYAGERLARVVCADREMLRDTDIDAIAAHVAAAQIARIGDAITRVRTRHSALATAIVTGSGDFLAHAAAERSGMQVSCIEVRASRLESRHEGVEGPSLESRMSMHEFSAFAVALLLESERSAS